MKQQGGKWGLERQGVTVGESRQNFSRVRKAAQAQAARLLGGNTEQLCVIFHTRAIEKPESQMRKK